MRYTKLAARCLGGFPQHTPVLSLQLRAKLRLHVALLTVLNVLQDDMFQIVTFKHHCTRLEIQFESKGSLFNTSGADDHR